MIFHTRGESMMMAAGDNCDGERLVVAARKVAVEDEDK